VRDSNDAITVHDLEGRILAWNPGAERIYGWREAEALRMNIHDMYPEKEGEEALKKVLELSLHKIIEPYHARRMAKDGRIVELWLTASALLDDRGEPYAIATTERESESRQ
jgi:two-component system, chemotaxis family, CheB/CheR fusion protein